MADDKDPGCGFSTETQLLGAIEGMSKTKMRNMKKKMKMKMKKDRKLALLEIKKQIVEFAEDFLVPESARLLAKNTSETC